MHTCNAVVFQAVMHDLLCDVYAQQDDETNMYSEFYITKDSDETILAGYYINHLSDPSAEHIAHVTNFQIGSPLPLWFDVRMCVTSSSDMLHGRVQVTGAHSQTHSPLNKAVLF